MSERSIEGKLDLGVAELKWKIFPPMYKSAMVEVILLGVVVETFTFSERVIEHLCDRPVENSNVIASLKFNIPSPAEMGTLVAKEFTCDHGARPQQMTNYILCTWDTKGNEQ